jgi:hypothetical protein
MKVEKITDLISTPTQDNCCSLTPWASCEDIETLIANLPLLKNLTLAKNL